MPEGVGYGPKDPMFSSQLQQTRVLAEKARSIEDSSGNRGVANKSDRVEVLIGKRPSTSQQGLTYENLRPGRRDMV